MQPISSHHDWTNEVSHEMVLRPYNHIKELQHEFSLRSHGFPSCDFLRLLLQEIFPLELRRKIFHTGNRLKLALAQKKKMSRWCSLHDYFLSHQPSSPCCSYIADTWVNSALSARWLAGLGVIGKFYLNKFNFQPIIVMSESKILLGWG